MFMNWKVMVEANCSITFPLVISSSPDKYSNDIAPLFIDLWPFIL